MVWKFGRSMPVSSAAREMFQLFCGNILWPSPEFETALVMFGPGGTATDESAQVGELLKKVGELTMERDFLARGLRRLG